MNVLDERECLWCHTQTSGRYHFIGFLSIWWFGVWEPAGGGELLFWGVVCVGEEGVLFRSQSQWCSGDHPALKKKKRKKPTSKGGTSALGVILPAPLCCSFPITPRKILCAGHKVLHNVSCLPLQPGHRPSFPCPVNNVPDLLLSSWALKSPVTVYASAQLFLHCIWNSVNIQSTVNECVNIMASTWPAN